MSDFLAPEALAQKLGISVRTLARWRVQGRGPKAITLGRVVRYAQEDVTEWRAANAK